MPVFVRNLALEFLVDNGSLRSDRMLEMYRNSRWREARGGFYLNHTLPSGVRFIFRAVRDGDNLRILGTDTHLTGRCVWNAVAFMNVTPKSSDALSAVVACTNREKNGVFVAHLVNAGVLPELQEGQLIAMQVVAFPILLSLYGSRREYERFAATAPGESTFPAVLADGQIFPLNFLLKHDPDIPANQKNWSLRDDIVLACGPVLDMRRCMHRPDEGSAQFIVATIVTQFGPLDVVFPPDMTGDAVCARGSYLVFSAVISADVAAEGFGHRMD